MFQAAILATFAPVISIRSCGGRLNVQPALASGDVDSGVGLGGEINDDLEAAVEQRERRDPTGLQTGELFRLALGGQRDFFLPQAFCQSLQVYLEMPGHHRQDRFAATLP